MKVDGVELIKTKAARLDASVIVDPFEKINFAEKHYDVFTQDELRACAGTGLIVDVECYPNYFLVAFRHIESRKVYTFEDSPNSQINIVFLSWVLNNFWTVGFNSICYDLPLLTLCLLGYRAAQLKEASNTIIFNDLKPRDFQEQYKVSIPKYRHVDLIEVCPLFGSLKLYGGRLHSERMQELPIQHTKHLTELEAKAVKLYCIIGDCQATLDIFNHLRPQLQLRHSLTEQYGIDLMSKSDAQIAEAVITNELKRMNGYLPKKPHIEIGTTYKYKVPKYITFETPDFQKALELIREADFTVGPGGYTLMPDFLEKMKLHLGRCTYRLGMGGLHSSETCIAHKADENTLLIDKDVASYYPAIILNLELFPHHLGKSFLRVYRDIVNRRLEAKKNGNKVVADSLKITINGSFGKLGNYYSHLYSPDLMIQVTVTGQLALLKLIELLEMKDISVISANTDGILIKCSKDDYPTVETTVIYWQQLTGFETEEARYKAIYCRDINNYVAIKEDGEIKVKGVYAEKGSSGNTVLSKNPESLICSDALTNFLANGKSIESTILECKNIRRFLSVRNVKGGAEKSGVYLGKCVRWYYSTEIKGEISYVTTGNKVPKTDNAKPCMDLPKEFPGDIDYARYINIAKEMLDEIGYNVKDKPLMLQF